MMRLSYDDLARAPVDALIRLLTFSGGAVPARKIGESDGAYRQRLVRAVQRAEKGIARSTEEAARRRA